MSSMKEKVLGPKIEKFGRWDVHNDEEVVGTYFAESNWDAIAQYRQEEEWAKVPRTAGLKASLREE